MLAGVSDENRQVEVEAVIPARPIATWSFRLEPREGGTRLWQTVLLGPARSGLSLAIDRWPDKRDRIIAQRLAALRRGMQSTVDGIKALAEQH